MAIETSNRNKTGPRVSRILGICAILFVVIQLTQQQWQPHIDKFLCGHLAAELRDRYGLVVRYEDPSEFFVSPLKPQVNTPDKGFYIGPTGMHSALIALKGVEEGLAKYPQNLIRKYLQAIFISGIFKIYNVDVGGTYFHSWIYVSATPDCDTLGSALYEKVLHHELSSLFMKGAKFPVKNWCAVNEPSFNYLESKIDVVHAAEGKTRKVPENAYSWYQAGFVHDYGMSSINNDVNMYAELAMTDPGRLKELAAQYPRIRAKTRILVEFYSSFAPELRDYFKRAGLIDDGVD
jgi:hypothetical protein